MNIGGWCGIILISQKIGGINVLSIVDLKKELGENIYIYPLHTESIKANSIDLHVSKFAWSLKTKKTIGNENYIIIDANDTALIYTEESIYVSHKIGGAYNSKVTLVSKGAGHIGTTLDAQYIGCSLVAIHNHSAEQLKIKVGSEFVTLQFWYLNSPGYENTPSHDNEPGHPRMLNGFEGVDKYIEWRDKNTWATRKIDLFHKMIESGEYIRCKEEYQRELDKFNEEHQKELDELKKIAKSEKIKRHIKIIFVILIICILLALPSYVFELGKVSEICKGICEKVLFPVIVTVLTTYVIVDYKEKE